MAYMYKCKIYVCVFKMYVFDVNISMCFHYILVDSTIVWTQSKRKLGNG